MFETDRNHCPSIRYRTELLSTVLFQDLFICYFVFDGCNCQWAKSHVNHFVIYSLKYRDVDALIDD
jgi:hypothetical protein